MKTHFPLKIAACLVLVFVLQSCKQNQIRFSGNVLSNSGKSVAGAVVKINESTTLTKKDGSFELFVKPLERNYLVSVRRFGFGYYSNRFDTAFLKRKIYLTQGTITEFDPSKDNTLFDPNSFNNPFKPALLDLDTAQLFNITPSVYDSKGNLVDLGYPEGYEGIFDYLKIPVEGGPGISVSIPANSIVDASGNAPHTGQKLRISLSTVDFFNPDGMPGDAIVRTKEGLGYMESFGAGTIEITDGKTKYNLKDGASAKIRVPIYPIRLKLKEKLVEKISLLRFNETDGVWDETGTGYLNKAGNAYEGEVNKFSVLNMDMIKTGNSKCYKIRQVFKQGPSDNSANYLAQYRALVVVPKTATTPFRENPSPTMITENSMGCVPVLVAGTAGSYTNLHPVTRIPVEVSRIAVVFSHPTQPDILGISFTDAASGTIPAATAVATAYNCASACNLPACSTTNDPHDILTAASSECNLNPGCWLKDCAFVPFKNLGTEFEIVGVPMGGGNVKIKWINYLSATNSMNITAYAASSCGTGGTVIFSKCSVGDCGLGTACKFGEFVYAAAAGPLSIQIEAFNDQTCGGGLTSIGKKCYSLTVL